LTTRAGPRDRGRSARLCSGQALFHADQRPLVFPEHLAFAGYRFEAEFLIQCLGFRKSVGGFEVQAIAARLDTESNRCFDQPPAEADAARRVIDQHPAQLGDPAGAQRNRRAADQAAAAFCEPDPAACRVVEDVLGDRLRNVGLELKAETRQALVDLAVQRDDTPQVAAAQRVSDIDRQVFDASKMLCIDASSIALNSSSDCCALRPSDSAREKLATMPFWRASRAFASSRE
jgi:hypothetical protein